jgi:hypothetical protein
MQGSIKGPFGRAYFSASALAHAKVVPNTSFSNGFTSEVLFQNELEGMSQKSGSPSFSSRHFCTIALPPVQIIIFWSCPQSLATYRRDRQVQGLYEKQPISRFAK